MPVRAIGSDMKAGLTRRQAVIGATVGLLAARWPRRALAQTTADSPAITIRHLLTHSEGFPEDNPWGDRQLHQPDETMRRWMRDGIPFSTAPGTEYEYSNYGFAILGQVVQRASGMAYADYVRKAILEPLGNAVHAASEAEVKDKKVVVFGCGPTGLFSVLAAKAMGAASVFAVDVNRDRLAMAKGLGADEIFDGTLPDLPARIGSADAAFEMSGNGAAITSALRSLRKGGTLIAFGLQLAAWSYLRRARKEGSVLGKLEFEEEMEPAVTELGLARD